MADTTPAARESCRFSYSRRTSAGTDAMLRLDAGVKSNGSRVSTLCLPDEISCILHTNGATTSRLTTEQLMQHMIANFHPTITASQNHGKSLNSALEFDRQRENIPVWLQKTYDRFNLRDGDPTTEDALLEHCSGFASPCSQAKNLNLYRDGFSAFSTYFWRRDAMQYLSRFNASHQNIEQYTR